MKPPAKTALWNPQNLSETNAVKFINYMNDIYGLTLQTYDDLYEWWVGDGTIDHFWAQAFRWLQISPSSTGYLDKEAPCFNPSVSTPGNYFSLC